MKMQELYEIGLQSGVDETDELDIDDESDFEVLTDLFFYITEIGFGDLIEKIRNEVRQINLDFGSTKPCLSIYCEDDDPPYYPGAKYEDSTKWLASMSRLLSRLESHFDIKLYFSRRVTLCDLDFIYEGPVSNIIPYTRSCRLNADSFTQYSTELYALEKMEELTLVLGEDLDERDMDRMVDGILNMSPSLKELEIDVATACSKDYLQFLKDKISLPSEWKISVEWNDPFELHGGGCVTIDELG